jgi:N-acetylneuraminic acid mutarotase
MKLCALTLTVAIAVAASAGPALASPQDRGSGWQPRASMPQPEGGLATTTAGRRIYTLGGFTSGFAQALNIVQSYRPASDSWAKGAPMPTARGDLGAANVNSRIYAIGGYDTNSDALDTVETYNPATGTWRTVAPLPVATGGIAAAAAGGLIYAVGGYDEAGDALASLEIYNPAHHKWTGAAPMPTARGNVRAAFSGGLLYVIGGADALGNPLDTVEAYDPRTDSWETKAPIPVAREGAAVAALSDGRIVVAGGCCATDGTFGPLTDVELYTASTNSWRRLADLPDGRGGLSGAAVEGNRFFALGGFVSGGQASSLVDALNVPTQPGDFTTNTEIRRHEQRHWRIAPGAKQELQTTPRRRTWRAS